MMKRIRLSTGTVLLVAFAVLGGSGGLGMARPHNTTAAVELSYRLYGKPAGILPLIGIQGAGHSGMHTISAGSVRERGAQPDVWAAYLGGKNEDDLGGIAADGQGNVYVTGSTYHSTGAPDFPITKGAAQAHYGGGDSDAFVASYAANGGLRWATYLGGPAADSGNGIAVDAQGNVYITGTTRSDNFPITHGAAQTSYVGNGDQAFVASYAANGQLRWATYLGGTDADNGLAVTVTIDGNVYVSGDTSSPDFPGVKGGAQPDFGNAGQDAFVAAYTTNGRLRWATYLGVGEDSDQAQALAVDGQGNIYVLVNTNSSTTHLPVTKGAAQAAYPGGDSTAFVAAFTANGHLRWGTYLGGKDGDAGFRIAADVRGNVYVTGVAGSAGIPITKGASQPHYGGGVYDAFVAAYTTDGRLRWATYLGGTGNDAGAGLTVDTQGNIYVTGLTPAGFPVTKGAAQPRYGGGAYDAFVAAYTANGRLGWATYLGGTSGDSGIGIAVDNGGSLYVAGVTDSAHFPGSTAITQAGYRGNGDAYVACLVAPSSK